MKRGSSCEPFVTASSPPIRALRDLVGAEAPLPRDPRSPPRGAARARPASTGVRSFEGRFCRSRAVFWCSATMSTSRIAAERSSPETISTSSGPLEPLSSSPDLVAVEPVRAQQRPLGQRAHPTAVWSTPSGTAQARRFAPASRARARPTAPAMRARSGVNSARLPRPTAIARAAAISPSGCSTATFLKEPFASPDSIRRPSRPPSASVQVSRRLLALEQAEAERVGLGVGRGSLAEGGAHRRPV